MYQSITKNKVIKGKWVCKKRLVYRYFPTAILKYPFETAFFDSIYSLLLFCLFFEGLKVTMKKHPSSFKLLGELAEKNKLVGNEPTTLYEGECFTCCFVALCWNL